MGFDTKIKYPACSEPKLQCHSLKLSKQTNKQTFITQYRLDTYYYDNAWFLGWSATAPPPCSWPSDRSGAHENGPK